MKKFLLFLTVLSLAAVGCFGKAETVIRGKFTGPAPKTVSFVWKDINTQVADSQKAIFDLGIPWNQLFFTDASAARAYGFSTIPQIFLFGPDGTLLKREGLRGEAIDQVLSEYLK